MRNGRRYPKTLTYMQTGTSPHASRYNGLKTVVVTNNPHRLRSEHRSQGIFNTTDEEEEEEDHPHPEPGEPPPPLPTILTLICNSRTSPLSMGGPSSSISNDEFTAAPNQAAASWLDAINLVEMTPTTTSHKSPKKETTTDTHSAKKKRSEVGRYTANFDSSKLQNMRTNEAIPSIDIVSQMWLGFPIHKATVLQKGKDIIREHRTNEDFTRIGPPQKKS